MAHYAAMRMLRMLSRATLWTNPRDADEKRAWPLCGISCLYQCDLQLSRREPASWGGGGFSKARNHE